MKFSTKNVVLLALMLASAGLASVLRPTISLANELPPIHLKSMVPTAFGDWRELLIQSNQIVNPQQQIVIDKIYSETLSRTYVNSAGYHVMLSIAYGKNQSDALQLHKPEVCYPSQGFTLQSKRAGELDLLGTTISFTQLKTKLELRFEPVTYWTLVGEHVTTGNVNKKLTEMRYALQGKIPDGMLIRVSSIDPNSDTAYTIQKQFAGEMILGILPEHRSRFAGTVGSH